MINIVDVKECPGYKISSLGMVYNKDMRALVPFFRGKKYLAIDMCNKRYNIHRLVGIYFVPNPHNKPQLNHKNGIKIDNWSGNFEWMTNSENMLHAWKNGLRIYTPKNRRG